ncbi:TetR/AcrR family transcriptional regulator [Microbacterium sp. RD1]|uniref:TetR/AcrR family transcriptional regulator n=1 Tax=Microbacterium sp. RD1 TaxID=3457313 RepID=UPI003FA57D99
MSGEERVQRERAARRAMIVSAARDLAEKEGWDAVTTRRLSTEIEYSQPVLYKHFASMEDIVAAVALEGFAHLAETLARARTDAVDPLTALRRVAHSFRRFAVDNPALYDAMFARSSQLTFAQESTATPMVHAFAELRTAVADALGHDDVDTLTEVLWAALHGLATLGRGGRLRPGLDDQRVDLLVDQFVSAHAAGPRTAP